MAANGDKQLTVRRTLLPDLEDLRDMFRFDTRWPFMLPSRLLRAEREAAAVDVFERGGNIVVKAEMPGIDPNKIDVTLVGNELRISGEREEEKEIKEEQYYRSERTYGRIYRALPLPEGCNADQISATAKDGVLEIVIPKKEPAMGKKVEVKTA